MIIQFYYLSLVIRHRNIINCSTCLIQSFISIINYIIRNSIFIK